MRPAFRASSAYSESALLALKCKSLSIGKPIFPFTVSSSLQTYVTKLRVAHAEITQAKQATGFLRVAFGDEPG